MEQTDLYSDVATMNLLATATKGFESLQELVKEFKVINKGNRSGGRGIFGGDVYENLMMN